jgi:hypothetical protein
MQFPSENWGENIDHVMDAWRYANAPELFAWIAQLPADQQRQIVKHYNPYLSTNGAEKEFNNVMDVPQPALRRELLEQFMRKGDRSKKLILAALEKSQLNAEEKAYFASLIPEPEYEITESPESADDE